MWFMGLFVFERISSLKLERRSSRSSALISDVISLSVRGRLLEMSGLSSNLRLVGEMTFCVACVPDWGCWEDVVM